MFLAYRTSACGGMYASGTDAFKQEAGWLVFGILGDEVAFEGFLKNGLTEAGRAGFAVICYCSN
jgi:hypothetical protein